MKTVSILFTQQHDWFSKFLVKIFGHRYSHVSLSLEEDRSEFYSFNIRGFVRETFEKFRRHNIRNSTLYEIEVTDDAYESMRKKILTFKTRCTEMKYSFLGIALCLFQIPLHFNKMYFCSEFVAEILSDSHAIPLHKQSALYLPDHLRTELDYCSGIRRFANVV